MFFPLDKRPFYRYNFEVNPSTGRIPTPTLRWDVLGSAARATLLPALALWVFSAWSTQAMSPSADWARYSVLLPAGPAEPSPEMFRRAHTLLYASHVLSSKEWNLWALARRYGSNMPSLQATNHSELIMIPPGSELTIQNKDGLLYRVQKESESLDSIIAKYRKDSASAAKFKQEVVQANRLPGTATVNSYELAKGEILLLPGIHSRPDNYGFPFLDRSWARISSRFGNRRHPILGIHRMHTGLDLPKPYGTKVYPSRNGRVVFTGWKEGYGNVIEVRHQDGWSTLYGHLSQINVAPGQWVTASKTLIGRVGSTGLSTGPHLHFEMRNPAGAPVNPIRRLRSILANR